MKKEVIMVLISEYADWECAFLSAALNGGLADADPDGKAIPKYVVKTLSLSKDYAYSFGGLKVTPDYDIHTLPDEYAALILIGGSSWKTDKADLILPLVEDAISKHAVLGAICDASLFLGIHGFLNNVKHTSNTLDDLKNYEGSKYTNEANYIARQAVSDNNIVTANGTAYLEFTKEILTLLEAYSADEIAGFYDLYKYGYYHKE